jgi:hypothetical protein
VTEALARQNGISSFASVSSSAAIPNTDCHA